MMTVIKPESFNQFYSQFYYKNQISKDIKKEYGIPLDLNTTEKSDEDIIEKDLEKGIYNVNAIAWKLGTKPKVNGDIDYRYYHYKNKDIEMYCDKAKSLYEGSSLKNYDLESEFFYRYSLFSCIRELYSKLVKTELPGKGFGAVQIINSMYFLSSGKVPIYDQYVHKAVLALEYHCSPGEIKLGVLPNKYDIDSVMCMYKKYIMLVLNHELPHYPEGRFLSRDQDQALWVYGHCLQSWDEI